MLTTDAGATWAGTHVFRASRLHWPSSLEQIKRVLAANQHVRVLGTRHSFNDLADADVLLSLTDLDPHPVLDEQSNTVSVSSGTRYGVLAAWLEQRGYALHNMGSLPHISVGGATSTATHGSGNGNGVLSTAIRAMDLVTAEGQLMTFDRDDDVFPGVAVSLGAVGVITRLTFNVEASYQIRQDLYQDLDWDIALERLEEVMGSGYSVSLFTNWSEPTIKRTLVKSRVDSSDQPMPDTFFGAVSMGVGDPGIADLGENRTTLGGVPGPWCERLPHFRLDTVPSYGDEIQSEYFVDFRDGADALDALRALGDTLDRCLISSEIRSVAADSLWLSMAYERASLAIHFTWRNEPDEVTRLIPLVEAALAPFSPRPHWGKWFAMEAEQIRSLYPRINDFAALRRRMDPAEKFGNEYLTRVLGL